MITDATLDLAVSKGLIEPGQAQALRSLARQEQPPSRPEPVDEEKLRFVTGFADIFVTLGLVLFLGAGASLLGRSLPASATAAIVAATCWLLAEFFTRRRRMALPSIALLLAFALASFAAIAAGLGGNHGSAGLRFGWLGAALEPIRDPVPAAAAGIGTALLAALHYWRFRVPVTVAAGVAALALTVLALMYLADSAFTTRSINALLLLIGLSIFGLAMRFDLSDPERVSRRTDIAFWLHLLASPLIVHSVFQGIGAGRGIVDPGTAVAIIGVFLALAIVAVLVDRRAMLVSGLVYAGVAFGSLIRQVGITDLGVPITLLALGAFVLALSAGWTPLRTALLRHLPQSWADRLPHPIAGPT